MSRRDNSGDALAQGCLGIGALLAIGSWALFKAAQPSTEEKLLKLQPARQWGEAVVSCDSCDWAYRPSDFERCPICEADAPQTVKQGQWQFPEEEHSLLMIALGITLVVVLFLAAIM